MIGKKRLFLLDYDGTLVGIKRTPSEAMPTPELLRTIRGLVRAQDNTVYIISGRDKGTLEWMFNPVERLGLAAEHGCYLRPVEEEAEWETRFDESTLDWKQVVTEAMDYYTERTPGSHTEEKTASLTWHYRLAEAKHGSSQANELLNHLEKTIVPHYPIEVITGKKNVEVRPVTCNKGNIVKDILSRHPESDFIFCIGDDRTDEDMFRVFFSPDETGNSVCTFSCRVGAGKAITSAMYSLKSPEAVMILLNRLGLSSAERNEHSTI